MVHSSVGPAVLSISHGCAWVALCFGEAMYFLEEELQFVGIHEGSHALFLVSQIPPYPGIT